MIGKNTGSVLIEVIIGTSLLLILALALAAIWPAALNLNTKNLRTVQAEFLVEEGWEGLTWLVASGWSGLIAPLNTNQSYHLLWGGSGWRATTTSFLVNNMFDQQFVLAPVYRDGSSNIASSGTLDPNSRQVTISVSWQDHGATTTKTATGYLTNLFQN